MYCRGCSYDRETVDGYDIVALTLLGIFDFEETGGTRRSLDVSSQESTRTEARILGKIRNVL